MSFYSKISLFALMAAGSIMGMEMPPRLKHPATSVAAQALNQPMISITCNGNLAAKIQKNYFEASKILKYLLKETKHNNTVELPDSVLEEFNWIANILEFEYKLKNKLISIYNISLYLAANGYTIKDLVHMLNACQRFELNNMSKVIIHTLIKGSERNLEKRKDTCLQTGSYQLPWTSDVAGLIANKMRKNNQLFYMVLTNLTERKQGKTSYWHILQNHMGTRRETSASSFLLRDKFGHFLAYNATGYLSEHPELIVDQGWCQAQGLINNPTILVNQVSDKDGTATLYWKVDPEILKIANNLKPEQITILIEYWNKAEQMPHYLRDKLPQSIRQVLFPNWWQRRSCLSKAAIIAGGAAATGFAAWYGYKHFSKEK